MRGLLAGLLLPVTGLALAAGAGASRPPILDMHVHALAADAQGPPPLGLCTPIDPMPTSDPARPYAATFLALLKEPPCDDPVWSPMTDAEVMTRTLRVMQRYNVIGVVSGTEERVREWREAAPARMIPGLMFNLAEDAALTPAALRALIEADAVAVFGEITNQYAGIAPDDVRMDPYWALAEELDVPVGIHVGTGPPGVIYLGAPGYRARLHSALSMEEVLVQHPRLRVYLMHAGYPLLDDLLALLYAHPQVYVGVGVIVHTQPRAAFYRFLRGIVEAGFGKRVMFGSDQMVWPETIERGIATIEAAPFLSDAQKRDILYNNAARFLRLSAETIARHHGM
jgi:predicted TIM-barrel fold metal-dependent hydrolase